MEQALKHALARFDRLIPRERLLVVLAVMALVYFVVDLALIGPQASKKNVLLQQAATQKIELATINNQISLVSTQLARDPLGNDSALRDRLKNTIAEMDALLGDTTNTQVDVLLKQMIAATPGLTLVSLKTLPVTTFFMSSHAAATDDKSVAGSTDANAAHLPPLSIYKHGVEVAIKGSYLDLLPYLEKLQGYPKRLFWGNAKLEVSAYPEVVFRVTIYTLSEQADLPLG